MSATEIDRMIYLIESELMRRHGCDAAARMIGPLKWYIYTGRASAEFLRLLRAARPVLVARDLANGGSDDDMIRRVCKRIKYTPC